MTFVKDSLAGRPVGSESKKSGSFVMSLHMWSVAGIYEEALLYSVDIQCSSDPQGKCSLPSGKTVRCDKHLGGSWRNVD